MACRLSIDFDKTLVYSDYPEILGLKPNALSVLNKLYNEEYRIIINTCRAGVQQVNAEYFLLSNRIPYHKINENLDEDIEFYGMDCRKISADIYIDDKQLGGIPDDWNEIYDLIKYHEEHLL